MLFRVATLPDEATAAAALFHAQILPDVLARLEDAPDHLTLVFSPADYTHRGWRLAAVHGLAREFAPVRVNAIESDDEAAIKAASSYCSAANGVTGQFLPLDSHGAERVL